MKIELHLLQNFPPSCLNRDDTNSPKDCEFGGVRRARISSQSLKRALREDFRANARVPAEQRAIRTKRIVEDVAKRVAEQNSTGMEHATSVVSTLLNASGLTVKSDEESRTEYLLFMPERSLGELAALIKKNWDQLKILGSPDKDEKEEEGKAKKSNKKKKADAAGAASEAIGKELARAAADAIYGTAQTPELALFGRMIADRPETNVDASCQVAHAISTHRVAMEFDYYTAVDDIKPRDNSGADMIGTIAFNSACFYRYSVLDVEQLARNLAAKTKEESLSAEEKKAAASAAKAWLEASFSAIPSARQNTFAAWTPPELVVTAVRTEGATLSLANAFSKPIRVDSRDGGDGLVPASAKALAKHFDDMRKLVDDKATIRVTSAGAMATPNGSEVAESFPKLVASIGSDLAAWVGA